MQKYLANRAMFAECSDLALPAERRRLMELEQVDRGIAGTAAGHLQFDGIAGPAGSAGFDWENEFGILLPIAVRFALSMGPGAAAHNQKLQDFGVHAALEGGPVPALADSEEPEDTCDKTQL